MPTALATEEVVGVVELIVGHREVGLQGAVTHKPKTLNPKP